MILTDSYWPAMLILEISYPVYQVNVTIMRNIHNHHHHLSNNWTAAICMSLLSFQQLKISSRTNKIPIYPEGIKNSSISRSSRHPVLQRHSCGTD